MACYGQAATRAPTAVPWGYRLTGERVSLAFLIGGALVLAGVYIGAIGAFHYPSG
jgi:drug/metabolite transporter (DMT)-like permease